MTFLVRTKYLGIFLKLKKIQSGKNKNNQKKKQKTSQINSLKTTSKLINKNFVQKPRFIRINHHED